MRIRTGLPILLPLSKLVECACNLALHAKVAEARSVSSFGETQVYVYKFAGTPKIGSELRATCKLPVSSE